MENNKVYWKNLLDATEAAGNPEPDFRGETVEWKDAIILHKKGFSVPQELIDYDDENIDYSDNPETDEEFWKEAVSAREGGEREYMRRMLLKEIEQIDIEHLPDLLEMVRAFRQKLPPEA